MPLNIPIVDLEINPATGEICYIELLVGTVHCISYQNGTEPPVVMSSSNTTSGPVPLYVGFSSDGTYDEHDLPVTWTSWIFGDDSAAVVDPNPTHVYTTAGVYIAVVHVRVGNYTVSSSVKITVGTSTVQAVMLSPIAGTKDSFAFSLYNNQNSTDR